MNYTEMSCGQVQHAVATTGHLALECNLYELCFYFLSQNW